MSKGIIRIACKCAECGGKTDCASIICADCLAEIINRVNLRNDEQDNNRK